MVDEARRTIQAALDESESRAAALEAEGEVLAAKASEAERRAALAEASNPRGRLTREQLSSCRAIQEAAGQLEALVPGVLGLVDAAERGSGSDRLEACAEDLGKLRELLTSARRSGPS